MTRKLAKRGGKANCNWRSCTHRRRRSRCWSSLICLAPENCHGKFTCPQRMLFVLSDNVRAEAVNLVFMLWPRQEHYCMQMKSEMQEKLLAVLRFIIVCMCVCVNLPVRLAAWRVAAGRAPASPLCGLSLCRRARSLPKSFIPLSLSMWRHVSLWQLQRVVYQRRKLLWQINGKFHAPHAVSNNKLQQLPINYSFNILYLPLLLLLLLL